MRHARWVGLLECKSIPEFVRELRRERNLTLRALAEQIGVQHGTIAAYEAGRARKPKGIVKALLALLAPDERGKLIGLYAAACAEELIEEYNRETKSR